ncbi:phenylacetate--CoA ligase family protein [Clostridium perfringens]|uniref:phenylacetate--CoA ligase family protein n=1 Tax=Clostridium perfringens TaxID=1502 RepID=UPI0018E48BDE|nr:phenylacetate--CoA ligase family protein [Clostridium perfringens]MBI5995327.1 phenylacetate--CoA ligase family protein [Clostridium perfringens]MDZ4964577.1 CoF synthetase [Clostridium perfringens]MDZ5013099.1 CoF synthetase [Clostridium perfringens]
MNFLEFGRQIGFWSLDKFKEGIIKKELRIMDQINSAPKEQRETYQVKKIKELLEHACTTTNYYSKNDARSLTSFPVITKSTIKENYDEFLSNRFNKDELYKMTTSGSTGTPFTCYQDYKKKKAVYAEVLYFNGAIGYSPGKRIIYLRSVVEECSKSVLKQFAQNIYLVDCYDLSDSGIEKIIKNIERLTRNNKAMLMGYASTLDAFRDYFTRNKFKNPPKCNLYGIVSGSEMLFDDTRESMEKNFHCPCISRYANEENGFLGQDFEENNIFFTNPAHYYYEVLKMNSNEIVENDEIGRIVVTDLRNFAMPMIRYDTGDVGRLVEIESKNGDTKQAIVDFGGRKIDVIYNCFGDRISPHSITNLMWKYTDINQYQLIQKNKNNYLVKINVDNFLRKKELKDDLLKVLGNIANIKFEYVEEIPVLASGKRKYIVNESQGV